MRRFNCTLMFCLLPALASAAGASVQTTAADHHLVVKGDTLWGISAGAFNDPGKWPDIWLINKPLIKDPHWIYPGQDVLLRLPTSPEVVASHAPVAPAAPTLAASTVPGSAQLENISGFSAQVISIYGGTSPSGQRTMVIIDKGQRDGVRNGLVLALYHKEKQGELSKKSLDPDASYGRLQVYRTLENVSYALVTNEASPVALLDTASPIRLASIPTDHPSQGQMMPQQ